MSDTPTEETPVYRILKHDPPFVLGQEAYAVRVEDGSGEMVVCENMYKEVAEWLVEKLQGQPFVNNAREIFRPE